MTKPYFFPPILNVLVGPNRSICNSCNCLEVETIFLNLKEVLICFLLTCFTEKISFQEILGSPFTKSFLDIFKICFRLTCPSFLCQIHLSSTLDSRHVTFCLLRSIKSISCKFLCRLAEKDVLPHMCLC